MVWTLDDLDALLTVLADSGYEVIGPTVRDGAIVYDRLGAAAELPAGWTEDRDAGRYRLRRRSDEKVFGYTVGPRSWKRYLYPPRVTVWSGRRTGDGFETVAVTDPPPRYAFVGVRPCDLAAIRVQDEVFAGRDPIYEQRRERALVVAVNCTEPSGTCFCQSMGTGPAATGGFDLALTELDGRFLVEAGSEAGRG